MNLLIYSVLFCAVVLASLRCQLQQRPRGALSVFCWFLFYKICLVHNKDGLGSGNGNSVPGEVGTASLKLQEEQKPSNNIFSVRELRCCCLSAALARMCHRNNFRLCRENHPPHIFTPFPPYLYTPTPEKFSGSMFIGPRLLSSWCLVFCIDPFTFDIN